MAEQRLGIIMNGVTGRMGMNQHLIRSILAIRAQGGVALRNGDTVMPDPILVGRNEGKLAQLANAHGISRWTTNLDAALKNPDDTLFFDAATTKLRARLLHKAIAAGKDIYCEKPIAENLSDALAVASAAKKAGVRHGVVQDKLFLPGLLKLRTLIDADFFGRIISVRGEFGYWVFEGDWTPAQRPSWNYRKKEGGGIILDMLCHWRYVLDNLFGEVKSVSCLGATHIPKRWDEDGKPYTVDVDDSAYATFQLAGGTVAHINSILVHARAPRRSRHLPRGRHPWLRGGRAAELLEPGAGEHAASGMESGRAAADQILRYVERGTRHDVLRERLQGGVGDDHPPSLRGRAVQMDAARRRQRRAACRGGAAQLEGAALDRHPASEGVRYCNQRECGGIHTSCSSSNVEFIDFLPLASFAELGFVCGKCT